MKIVKGVDFKDLSRDDKLAIVNIAIREGWFVVDLNRRNPCLWIVSMTGYCPACGAAFDMTLEICRSATKLRIKSDKGVFQQEQRVNPRCKSCNNVFPVVYLRGEEPPKDVY